MCAPVKAGSTASDRFMLTNARGNVIEHVGLRFFGRSVAPMCSATASVGVPFVLQLPSPVPVVARRVLAPFRAVIVRHVGRRFKFRAVGLFVSCSARLRANSADRSRRGRAARGRAAAHPNCSSSTSWRRRRVRCRYSNMPHDAAQTYQSHCSRSRSFTPPR
jgi:hypothetical protein